MAWNPREFFYFGGWIDTPKKLGHTKTNTNLCTYHQSSFEKKKKTRSSINQFIRTDTFFIFYLTDDKTVVYGINLGRPYHWLVPHGRTVQRRGNLVHWHLRFWVKPRLPHDYGNTPIQTTKCPKIPNSKKNVWNPKSVTDWIMAIARTGVFVDDYLECNVEFSPSNLRIEFGISFDSRHLDFFFSDFSDNFFPQNFGFGYLDSSTLPAELQRLLSTMRELDDRSQGFNWSFQCF